MQLGLCEQHAQIPRRNNIGTGNFLFARAFVYCENKPIQDQFYPLKQANCAFEGFEN